MSKSIKKWFRFMNIDKPEIVQEKGNEGGEYYDLKDLLATGAQYCLSYGERSAGKSYSALLYGLERYFSKGYEFVYLRRLDVEITGKKGGSIFSPLIENEEIERLSGGEWNSVYYYSGNYFLEKRSENGEVRRSTQPFAYALALSNMIKDKGRQFPKVNTIIFDEFMTTRGYLKDEVTVAFFNVISTVKRKRQDFQVIMLGNTIDITCPYFKEMGLYNYRKQKPGTIEIYKMGDSGLRIALEHTASFQSKEKVDPFFAFDDPKVKMITDGSWAISLFPRCPIEYDKYDVRFRFYILTDEKVLEGKLIYKGKARFIFISQKRFVECYDEEKDIIYCEQSVPLNNWKYSLDKPNDRISGIISKYFALGKVYYDTNETGELINKYRQRTI